MSKKTSVHGTDDFGIFTGPVRYINFGTLVDHYKSFVCDVLDSFAWSGAAQQAAAEIKFDALYGNC